VTVPIPFMSRPDAIPFNCVCCTVFMGVIKSCLEKVYDMLAPVSKARLLGGGATLNIRGVGVEGIGL
jgi:hypothetical protein